MVRFVKKGTLVGVEGRLNQRSYQNKDGKNVHVIEVICDSVQFLERKEDGAPNLLDSVESAPAAYEPDPESVEEPAKKNVSSIDVTDDDLPF